MRPNRLLFWTDSKGYLRLRSWYAAYLTFKTLLTSRFYFNVIPHGEQQTVFDKITESPDVLAEKLVYRTVTSNSVGLKMSGYKSTIVSGFWAEKECALAATVVELKKEVAR